VLVARAFGGVAAGVVALVALPVAGGRRHGVARAWALARTRVEGSVYVRNTTTAAATAVVELGKYQRLENNTF
jgi:hypothetical protein